AKLGVCIDLADEFLWEHRNWLSKDLRTHAPWQLLVVRAIRHFLRRKHRLEKLLHKAFPDIPGPGRLKLPCGPVYEDHSDLFDLPAKNAIPQKFVTPSLPLVLDESLVDATIPVLMEEFVRGDPGTAKGIVEAIQKLYNQRELGCCAEVHGVKDPDYASSADSLSRSDISTSEDDGSFSDPMEDLIDYGTVFESGKSSPTGSDVEPDTSGWTQNDVLNYLTGNYPGTKTNQLILLDDHRNAQCGESAMLGANTVQTNRQVRKGWMLTLEASTSSKPRRSPIHPSHWAPTRQLPNQ
ncbi:hypothetical protein M427DRAFT_493354, partial [Gonapodya prolifera JEL478]